MAGLIMDIVQQPLWNHQKIGIERAMQAQSFALFFSVGTGKTRTMIEILRRKFSSATKIRKTVIFAPLIVLKSWKSEFAKFSKVRQDCIFVLEGDQKKRVKQMKFIMEHEAAVVILNYESLQMQDLMAEIYAWKPEILVCDESHRLKNPSSLRAKKAMRLADSCLERYILTGTPILNSPMDIYMQFRILDKGLTFGSNFYAFRARYFVDGNDKWKGRHNYFPNWQPRKEMYPDMSQKIQTKSMRAIKSECLDLPPFVRKTVSVELTKAQRKAYSEMEKDFVTYVANSRDQDKAVVASLALTKALRMQQIVSGYAIDVNGETVTFKENPKLDALIELLEDMPGVKVIVWAVYKENYRAIREGLERAKIAFTEMTGDTKQKDREANLEAFRKDPDVNVLVSNQSAGGIGITLIESSVSIYFSKNFSLEQDLQSEARNYRGGSERHVSVTRIDLVAKDTLDEVVTNALQSKLNMSEVILAWGSQKEKVESA